jgi:rRNA biogenesis protein RRP5
MFLDIAANVDGVVWPMHYADIRLKNPEKKFKPGQVVKARVSSPTFFDIASFAKSDILSLF